MASIKSPRLGKLKSNILKLLELHPEGLSIYEIRDLLPPDIGHQQHLDKRVRELREYFILDLESKNGKQVYVLKGKRPDPVVDDGYIPAKLRAQILHEANGRCQMCGRSIKADKISLQLDHRVPRNWNGATEAHNLWAICQLCNGGKRDYFATFDEDTMARILKRDSVYERILETLRLNPGEATPSWLLGFVANFEDWQEDWHKRLRELRYPVIGMKITSTRKKNDNGKWESAYKLVEDRVLPKDHKFLIKEFERQNRKKRRTTPEAG